MMTRMTGLRTLARALGGLMTSSPFVGAVVVVGLQHWTSPDERGDVAASRMMRIALLAAAIALGVVLGLFADVVRRARYGSPAHARTARRSAATSCVETAGVCLALLASLLFWGMARSPQLYAPRFYAKGGLLRMAQDLATDVLGTHGVALGALGAAFLFVGPARIARRARRALSALRRAPGRATLLIAALVVAATAASGAFDGAPSPRRVGAPDTAKEARPNILLLAVSSLRADRLEPRVAPNLDRLAARGVRFERETHVSIRRALPSWVPILTGRHNHHRGSGAVLPTRSRAAASSMPCPHALHERATVPPSLAIARQRSLRARTSGSIGF